MNAFYVQNTVLGNLLTAAKVISPTPHHPQNNVIWGMFENKSWDSKNVKIFGKP